LTLTSPALLGVQAVGETKKVNPPRGTPRGGFNLGNDWFFFK
jgi:hypothetical protein